jgi:hypothetical protein
MHGWRWFGDSRREPARGRLFALPLFVLPLLLAVSACSRQKLVVASTAPLIAASMEEVYRSSDVETVRRGLPAQILLMRGLCRSDPDRLDSWITTVQLYASYAMIFVGDEETEYQTRLYSEGRELGLRFLRHLEWFDAAWRAGPDSLRAELEDRRPRELAPLLMWTAACLGQYVLHNQDNPREMLDLPYVHVMLESAIALDGDYFYGMPYVVEGITMATIPQGLGGNLAEADRYFDKAFAVTGGRYLLYAMLYARHVCVAALDEAKFVATLEAVLAAPDELPEARFMNTVAKQRAAELLARRAEFF